MNKISLFLLSGVLIFGAAACDGNAKTSSDAPDSVTGQVENPRDVEETREDAASEVRQD